jgi:hypothetical protein
MAKREICSWGSALRSGLHTRSPYWSRSILGTQEKGRPGRVALWENFRGVCRLVGLGKGHVDAASFAVEEDVAFDEGKEGVVFAHANVCAGVPFRSALADDDVARDDFFATEFFDAEALAA